MLGLLSYYIALYLNCGVVNNNNNNNNNEKKKKKNTETSFYEIVEYIYFFSLFLFLSVIFLYK